MPERKTATHKVLADGGGYRFMFYCDLSGAHICTTKEIYYGNTQEEALQAAWQAEGRSCLNQCRKCGKWVSLAMYNVDVLECVECAPFEAEAKFCKSCSGEDSPKVIKSTEIISFKCEVSLYSVVLEKDSKLLGRNYKLSAALENGNIRCTVEWHDRAGSKEKYDFTTDASFMINVQEIAAKYNFAKFNGYISKVSGLPDMYGAKLDITYASNETIYACNNQDMFIPFEAVEDLVEIFNCDCINHTSI